MCTFAAQGGSDTTALRTYTRIIKQKQMELLIVPVRKSGKRRIREGCLFGYPTV